MLVLLRPIPVRSLLRDFHSFHSDLWPGANCSLVGIGQLWLGVALQIVVPPIMLALLFEEVVTVAGLYEGSSSLISGGLGLVGGYDRDGECHQLASCVQSCWLPICERQVGRYQPGHIDCQHS